MGYKITSPDMFAIEFRDFISRKALSGKELKSISKSVNYKLSILKPLNKTILNNELVYLNTYLGCVAIKYCFSVKSKFSASVVDEITDIYKRNLILQWIPKSFKPVEFFNQNRLNIWEKLFTNLDSNNQPLEDMSFLSCSFYEILTKKQCNPKYKFILSSRFNKYMGIFVDYIFKMIEDFKLQDEI